jgi:putative sigma-54 modulation protein
MKITYTGRHIDLTPAQAEKLETEFKTVGKLLDNGWGEAEARVVFSHNRHLNHAEVTVPYHHHELVGEASDGDLFTALHEAVRKLEAQAIKVRTKWRDGKRVPKTDSVEPREGQI